MKIISKINDLLTKFLYKLDQRLIFIIVEPKRYPSDVSNLKILNNLFFFLKDLKFKSFLKELLVLIFFNFIFFLKIIYFPISLIILKLNLKFTQLNFSQVGILNEHLNFMVKQNKLDGFNSIILIPKNSKFGFLKEVFENLRIIDNRLLNVLLIPLKHSEICSCKTNKIDNFLNKNFELKLKAPHSKIFNRYEKSTKNSNTFILSKEYIKKEEQKFFSEHKNLDLNRLIIFHHRENFFNKTSDLRGSLLETYIEGIELLLQKKYSVMRLIDKSSKRIPFFNKNYFELSVDELQNKKSQFFLIKKSKGFLGTSSGPISIASLFNTPILETNIYGQRTNAFTKKGSYILKKVKKDGEILSYDQVIKLKFYKGFYYSRRKLQKEGISIVNNSSEEIYKAIEHFDYLLSGVNYEPTIEQKNFKKFLPDYMELKFANSNIDPNFINLNRKLFYELINQ